MKKLIVVVLLVSVALAYLAGFWPQRRRLSEARAQERVLQDRLAVAEGRTRLADVLGQLLRLEDAVAVRNFGEASTLSSSFFDSIRDEAPRAGGPDVTATLQGILKTRDQVTTAIAGTDPSLTTVLKEHERTLRRALGYPVSGA